MLENDQADSMQAHGPKWNGLMTLLNYHNLIKGPYFPSAGHWPFVHEHDEKVFHI